ncbi:MAG: hypothetical protein ABI076_13020 [Acidobacteriaceae bacterium]
MSTTTATVAPSVSREVSHAPERLYSVNREKFAQNFNRHPFMLDHSLSSHPAFTMDRLYTLLERSLPIPNKVYWNAGKKGINQRWDDRPGRDFSIEEAFRRIRETDAWIIIFGADRDPEIHDLLEQGLAEVQEMTGIALSKEAKSRQSIIFITSPRRITEYHIDRECSLLMQVYGKKTIHVFDQTDREVLSEEELERFWTADTNAATYKPHLQHRASSFLLEPGKAVHIPINAPHWLENGDDISVSVNQNFEFLDQKLGNVYRANYYARKMGFHPRPPGQSQMRDAIKAQGMRFPSFAAQRVRALGAKLKKEG